MSERCISDNSPYIGSGKALSTAYNGFGILFENLPSAGENGASPLLNDGGVNGDEVRWELLSQTGLTVDQFNEDGSFATTGTGSFDYRSFINNVSAGDFTVTVNSANVSISIESGSIELTGSDMVFTVSGGILIESAAISLAASDIGLIYGRILALDSAAISLAGSDMNFTVGAAPSYSISIESASIALAGSDIGFIAPVTIVIDSGSIAMQASPMNLIYSEAVALRITGFSVNFKQREGSFTFKSRS